MIHPATELRYVDPTIGYGVFATAFMPAGSITWVQDELDQMFTTDQVSNLSPHYRAILDKYTFTDAAGRLVLCWDHARFVNHSCEPTCLSTGYDFEIALRDLQPGDELTDDYGTLNLRQDFKCACLSPQCRQIIRPDDMERHAATWDAKVEPLFSRLGKLPQPLWPFLKEKEAVEQALAGWPATVRSGCIIVDTHRAADGPGLRNLRGRNLRRAPGTASSSSRNACSHTAPAVT